MFPVARNVVGRACCGIVRSEAITEGLERVWRSQGRQFVSFEADEDRWVQYLDGELNVSWPGDEDPAGAFDRLGITLPTGAFVESWSPGTNAIVAVGALLLPDVATLIDALATHVLGLGAGESLDCRVLDHG